MPPKDKKTRAHGDDLRGASRLAIDATERVTEVVEEMHRTIASGPDLLGRPLEGPVAGVTRLVYGSIRGVTRAVGAVVDAALGQLAPLLGESAPGPERDAVLAALNGVIGDFLCESGNPLATTMRLCHEGRPLDLERGALRDAFPRARGRLLLLCHGSCMNDRQWHWGGRDPVAALARDLGYSAVYLRYNSGLHISQNGRELAAMLGQLVEAWPVDVESLTIVGHSMGGLVARSACLVGDDTPWRPLLRDLVCLGTPHHGAPLERGGNWVDVLLGVTRYSAPLARLGKLRSAGVTDLRFGNVLDEHWQGRDRFAHAADPRLPTPLPAGVDCFAIAGTRSLKAGGKLWSDGMVPVESALGRHDRAALTLPFPKEHQWIGYGIGHLELLARPEVYARVREWLAA